MANRALLPDITFFWGDDTCFSDTWHSPFVHRGRTFFTAEQAVVHRMMVLFGERQPANISTRQLVLTEVPWFQEVWSLYHVHIYKEVLIDKFSGRLKATLLATGDNLLAFADNDYYWGIGMHTDNPYAPIPELWPGRNMKGRVIMQVREYQ